MENVTYKDKVKIHLLTGRNLLWDILMFPSSHRTVSLYVILTLQRAPDVNQPPYALLHIRARHAMHGPTGDNDCISLSASTNH